MQIKHHSCYKCKTEIETSGTKCAKCGRPLFSRTNVRVRGAIMTLMGGFLIVFMGYISSWMYGAIFHPATANGAKFNGDSNQLLMIGGIFGLVFLFSFIGVVAGIWQLIFGRRNMILVWSILGIGIILFIGVGAFLYIS